MSQIVYIKRKPNTTRLPDDVYAGSKRKIGAYNGENGVVTTGLTPDEEEKILPGVLGVAYDSIEFLKRKEAYYNNISIDIPLQGASLQVGVDNKGRLIKPVDYLKYKFAKLHPWVAEDEKSSMAVGKKFFIHDPKVEIEAKKVKLDARKNAYKEFVKVSADSSKMRMVCNLLGTNPDSFSEESLMEGYLEEIATTTPDMFIAKATDKDLEMKAFIMECVSMEVITKVGTTYLEGDEPIGSSLEEAVLNLNDKANSDVLARLKARLKEFQKSKKS